MELETSKTGLLKTYTYKTNDTVALFNKICNIVYFGCGCNFLFDNLLISKKLIRIYDKVSKIFEALAIALILSEWGAFFTQRNLPLIHKSNMFLFGPTSVTLYSMYLNAVYRKEQIKELSYTLAVTLKEMYSDPSLEKRAIRKTWRFVIAMVCMVYGLASSTGVVAGYEAWTTNATFTTMVPMWPDLEDRSLAARVCRIVHYVVWWVFVTRVGAVYFIILPIAITLQCQFAILHEYFLSLKSIFEGDGAHEEKERRYEKALKLGVKMHSLTVWCTEQTQLTCGLAFSTQVVTNVYSLILLMIQWMHMERTFGNIVHIFLFVGTMLIGTGIFMWNAGDITFEDRVVIKGLGILDLSYESYISIVKSSYSVFSVMY